MGDLSIVNVLTRATSTRSALGRSLKSTLQRISGTTYKLSDGAFWSAFFHGNSSSGQEVSARTVLSLSTAWACTRLKSQTVATLPFEVYERRPDGSRVVAPNHPLYELLHYQPNGDMTAVEFWESTVAAMELWGNSYSELIYSGTRLIAIDFLLPHRMNVARLYDGSLQYRYNDRDGTSRVIPESRIWHLKAFGIDGCMGMSSIRHGAEVFGAAIAADHASAKVFANGMNVGGVLMTDKVLNKEQREEYRKDLADKFAGAMNTGKTMMLESGLKYQQVPMNPEDAQLLATRGFNVEEICRWFGVPPVMVGHGDKQSSWPTSTEAQGMIFLTYCLRSLLKRIELSARRSLIVPAERSKYFCEFTVEGLLRADTAARASLYASAAQNGWMDREEIRALENLPPKEGAAGLTVQSNLVRLDQLGVAPPAAEAVKTQLLDWLGIKEEAPHES